MAEDTPPPVEDDDIPKASARTSVRLNKDVAGSFRTDPELYTRSKLLEPQNKELTERKSSDD